MSLWLSLTSFWMLTFNKGLTTLVPWKWSINWKCISLHRQLGKEEDDEDIMMGMDEEQAEEEKPVSLSEQKVNYLDYLKCSEIFHLIKLGTWRMYCFRSSGFHSFSWWHERERVVNLVYVPKIMNLFLFCFHYFLYQGISDSSLTEEERTLLVWTSFHENNVL